MSFKERLTEIFGKDAVKKALIWVLVVVVGTVVLLTQFMFPVHVKYEGARLYSYSGDKFSERIKGVYNSIASDDYKGNGAVLSDTTFTFDNPEDYLRVELIFDFTNIGVYKISNVQFQVNSIGKHKEAFLFKESNFLDIDRYNNQYISLYLCICTKGLTEEEITEAVNSLDISYTFDRPELFSSGGDIEYENAVLPFDNVIEG